VAVESQAEAGNTLPVYWGREHVEMKKQPSKSYAIDMCNGTLADKILKVALPLALSSILQLLFNAADIVVVGRFAGKEALAAVGTNSSLVLLIVNLFIGLSVGTNAMVARDLGAGRQAEIGRGVHTAIALAIASGLGLMVFGVSMAGVLMQLLAPPADVIDLATLYLRIYSLGMPGNMVYNFGAAILRAKGDTRRPMVYLTIAGVVNVVLNLYFVIVLHMSVAGVALATAISQYTSALLVVRCLMKEEEPLRLDLRKLRIEWPVIRRIMQVGLPAGCQSIVFSLSNVVIQTSINSFDDAALVAGSSAANNIEGFIYAAMNAFYQTAMTFSSQNYGAGKCKRVDRVLLWCVSFGALVGMALGGLAVVFSTELASIYAAGDEVVISWAVLRLHYIALPYFLCACMDVPVGVLRGLGHSVVPMVASMLGACGLRLLWVATVFQMYHTVECLLMAYPVSWMLTATFHYIYFFRIRKSTYAAAERQLHEA